MDTACYFHIWVRHYHKWECRRYNNLKTLLTKISLLEPEKISINIDSIRNIGLQYIVPYTKFEGDILLFLACDSFCKDVVGGGHSYFLSEQQVRQLLKDDLSGIRDCWFNRELADYLKNEGFSDLKECLSTHCCE